MSVIEFGERLEGIDYEPRPGAYGIGFRKVKQSVEGRVVDEVLQLGLVHTPRGRFLPGGGIEGGESHEEAIKREFIEEIGRDVKVLSFVTQANQAGLTPRTQRYVVLQGYFYLVEILGPKGQQVEEDHELRWIDLDEALTSLRLMNQSYAVKEAIQVYLGL